MLPSYRNQSIDLHSKSIGLILEAKFSGDLKHPYKMLFFIFYVKHTAWKVSVFGDFLVLMRENTDQKNSDYGHLKNVEI